MIDAERAGLADDAHPPPEQSRLVPRGLRQPLRAVLPAGARRAPHRVLRPGDRGLRADRHLLRHAPPAVRRGRLRTRCTSAAAAPSSAGWTRSGTTRPATSSSPRAGARPSSTPTATGSSRSRGTSRPRVAAAARRRSTRRSTRACWSAPTASSRTRSTTPSGSSRTGLPRPDAAARTRRRSAGELRQRDVHGAGGAGVPDPRPGASTATGYVWTALAGSSHFASFDRGKCTVFGGPEVRDGRQCDEGWSFYKVPGPNFRDTDIGTDFHYYNWVDQFNTLGLGRERAHCQRVELRLAAGARSADRRVDHPARALSAGIPQPWPRRPHRRSGRRLEGAAASTPRTAPTPPGTSRGGPVEPGNLVKFQIRPDPLAH